MTNDAELLSLDEAAGLAGITRRMMKRLTYIHAVPVAQEDALGKPLVSRKALIKFLASGKLKNVKFPARPQHRPRAAVPISAASSRSSGK